MRSEIELINAALSHLGEEKQISDPNEDPPSRQLRVARGLLPALRDAMLRSAPWLCAERRLTLNKIPALAAADWKFRSAFLLPPEELRVWLADIDCPFQKGPYVEYNLDNTVKSRRKAIYANYDGPIDVTVIERIDYEFMDACLFDAMGYELACRMAGPLQADMALKKSLKADAREALITAVTSETSEFTDGEIFQRGRWLEAR